MAPTAMATELDDPRRYVRRRSVPVFDAHVERGDDGEVARKFSRKDLEEIAANCNRRASQGSYAPLTLGHTDPDQQDESKQPAIVGYARNYRVAYSKRLSRWVIEADLYVKRDRWKDATGYPRISVELWPSDRFFDPIALLRRTPQRDLGQWCYARGAAGNAVLRYSMQDQAARGKPMDEHDPIDEAPLDDAPMDDAGMDDAPLDDAPMDDAPPELSHEEKAEQFMKHCFSHPHAAHFAKHYAMPAEPPMDAPPEEPAHDPVDPPSATAADPEYGDDDTEHYSMPSATNGALPAPVAGKDEADAYSKARRELNLTKAKEACTVLKAEGYLLAPGEEERMAAMEPAQRKERFEEVRRYNRKAPTGGARVPLAQPKAPKKDLGQMTEGQLRKAVQYMKDGLPWEKAARKAMRASGN